MLSLASAHEDTCLCPPAWLRWLQPALRPTLYLQREREREGGDVETINTIVYKHQLSLGSIGYKKSLHDVGNWDVGGCYYSRWTMHWVGSGTHWGNNFVNVRETQDWYIHTTSSRQISSLYQLKSTRTLVTATDYFRGVKISFSSSQKC